MPIPHTLTAIRRLIDDCPGELEALSGIPTSYAALQHACMQTEMVLEKKKLSSLFKGKRLNEQTLKEKFKALCRERYQQNQSTYLSYQALPEGLCNQLYWQIATQLFQPANLGEMLAILMPPVTTLLQAEVVAVPRVDASSHRWQDRCDIQLTSKSMLDALASLPCDVKGLQAVVIAYHYLMPIKPLAHLPYALHVKAQTALSLYPAVRDQLYTHNKSWQALAQDLQEQHTPEEALSILIADLQRSGTRFTGRHRAGPVAESAVARFQAYLEAIPKDLRDALHALKANSGKTLDAVLKEYVEKDRCNDATTDDLISIRAADSHQALLNQLPERDATIRQKIEAHYNRLSQQEGLSTKYDVTLVSALPDALLAEALGEVAIKTEEDCLELLLHLPPEEYGTMLTHARINQSLLTNKLARVMAVLTDAQCQAFTAAIISQKAKLGGISAVLRFSVESNEVAMVRQVLQSATSATDRADLLAAVKKKNEYGDTVLHCATHYGNAALVQAILELYPENERLAAVEEKNKYDETVLHCAAYHGNAALVQAILELYPENKRLAAVTEKNKHGVTVQGFTTYRGNDALVRAILRQSLQAYVARSLYAGTASPDRNVLNMNTSDFIASVKAAHDPDITAIWEITQKHTYRYNLQPDNALKAAREEYQAGERPEKRKRTSSPARSGMFAGSSLGKRKGKEPDRESKQARRRA